MLALLFPGQGSQEVGMARDVCRASQAARDVFALADAALELPLSTLCFEEAPDATLEGSTRIRGDDRAFLVEALKKALGDCTTSAPARRARRPERSRRPRARFRRPEPAFRIGHQPRRPICPRSGVLVATPLRSTGQPLSFAVPLNLLRERPLTSDESRSRKRAW